MIPDISVSKITYYELRDPGSISVSDKNFCLRHLVIIGFGVDPDFYSECSEVSLSWKWSYVYCRG